MTLEDKVHALRARGLKGLELEDSLSCCASRPRTIQYRNGLGCRKADRACDTQFLPEYGGVNVERRFRPRLGDANPNGDVVPFFSSIRCRGYFGLARLRKPDSLIKMSTRCISWS
jgi:hypothetical protein